MFDRVEKYDIIEEIGRGGMATVYRARDTRLHREVALKVMHPHLQGAREARIRFEREARTVARLRHRGLLEIYDYSGEDSPVSFIATELLTGPTLKAFAEQHHEIPAELAACMVLQVAEALAAAHEAGVIHRDVKPENVMFHQSHVKLTDFGIAQLVDVQGMTTTGQVLGSPGHMAPEQIEGKECTVQSDLFSLGTVLYLLATGELPFRGANTPHVLKRIVEGDYVDPLKQRASVGAPLSRIITRCLATDPARRYKTAAELADDLAKFVAAAGIKDPEAALERYLADPEGYAQDFTADLVERLIARGEALQRAHKVPAALDDFNRVLSLDDGNPRVLASVQRLGRRSRVRRVGLWATAISGLVLAVFGVLALDGGRGSDVAALTPAVEVLGKLPVPAASVPSTGAGRAEAAAGREPEPPDHSGDGPSGSTASPPTRAAQAAARQVPARGQGETRPRPPNEGGGEEAARRARPRHSDKRPERHPDPAAAPAGQTERRRVRFSPSPANVSISVDGGPARVFGPSFREVELSPGRHTFKFVGGHDCCEDLEFAQDIPPGPGTTTVSRALTLRPAGLYVVTDRPADVSVNDGAVKGRTRSVLRVPHERALVQTHKVIVSAAGFEPFEARVQLQAGQVKTLEVPMRALTRAKGAARMKTGMETGIETGLEKSE